MYLLGQQVLVFSHTYIQNTHIGKPTEHFQYNQCFEALTNYKTVKKKNKNNLTPDR